MFSSYDANQRTIHNLFEEINTSIQQGWNELIKSDIKTTKKTISIKKTITFLWTFLRHNFLNFLLNRVHVSCYKLSFASQELLHFKIEFIIIICIITVFIRYFFKKKIDMPVYSLQLTK